MPIRLIRSFRRLQSRKDQATHRGHEKSQKRCVICFYAIYAYDMFILFHIQLPTFNDAHKFEQMSIDKVYTCKLWTYLQALPSFHHTSLMMCMHTLQYKQKCQSTFSFGQFVLPNLANLPNQVLLRQPATVATHQGDRFVMPNARR